MLILLAAFETSGFKKLLKAESHLDKILHFQKRILCMIYIKPFDFPSAKLFQENRILPAEKLFKVKVFTSAYSLFYSNKCSLVTHDHFTRKSSSTLPIPLYTSSAGQNSRSYQQSNLWNQLPLELRNIESLIEFKRRLKDHLLSV